jgi:hypothetical protein
LPVDVGRSSICHDEDRRPGAGSDVIGQPAGKPSLAGLRDEQASAPSAGEGEQPLLVGSSDPDRKDAGVAGDAASIRGDAINGATPPSHRGRCACPFARIEQRHRALRRD